MVGTQPLRVAPLLLLTMRGRGHQEGRRPSPVVLGAVLAATLVVLWGGYGRHWSWTGINGKTATLWDWLHLLLLPVAFGALPIWLSRKNRLGRRHKGIAVALMSAFTLLVLIGYTAPWGWTGFVGNKLWDWLELLALPVAVALTPVYGELAERWNRRYAYVAMGALLLLFVAVLGGYLGNWGWTGFRGNTLWDWLHLLLLPLLLPTLVVPALMPVVTAGLTPVAEEPPSAERPPSAASPAPESPAQSTPATQSASHRS